MASAMTKLNVNILTGANQMDFWEGSPASEGGELDMIDVSPVNGPPQFDYDDTGNARKPYMFKMDSKIPGATTAAQDAYILKYKKGTKFTSDQITGLSSITGGNIDFVVSQANVKHSDGQENARSTLSITLHEVGPVNGATTPVGSVATPGG